MLEFDKIIERLAELAQSQQARMKLEKLMPYMDEALCTRKVEETTQARYLLEALGTPPLSTMADLQEILKICDTQGMLLPHQLEHMGGFINSCLRMQSYLKRMEHTEFELAYYGRSFADLAYLKNRIEESIHGEKVADSASVKLRSLRRKIEHTDQKIKAKLDSIMKSKGKYMADSFISVKNGRFVLPVKREYKGQVPGSVVAISSSGGTCFIEPEAVLKMQEECTYLQIEAENEEHRILYELTDIVGEARGAIEMNMEVMEVLDIAFAKGKLSQDMKAVCPEITTERKIDIRDGRHPLLEADICVPLQFHMEAEVRGVVITGPNTGGKTVALKTVGLLSMMAQSGLHVPAREGCLFGMFDQVLSDIGDGQSISENLSTFSAHITNITAILRAMTRESLVLLDELGSGTDPAEGMGIAIAILDELRRKECMFVATTHYPEVKDYAQNMPGLLNARMAFDKENLSPLYQLEIGEAGESCALYIAKRLDFPPHLIEIAKRAAYGSEGGRNKNRSRSKEAEVHFPKAADELAKYGEEAGSGDQELYRELMAPKQEVIAKQKKKREHSKIKQAAPEKKSQGQSRRESFKLGDSVFVYPGRELGLVFREVNEEGMIGVQIKKKKRFISYKRLKLNVSAADMYPPDYDFSIIFDTVENRKARHKMTKRHRPDLEVKYEDIQP